MAEVIRGECTGQDLGWLEEQLAAPGAQLASLLGPVTLRVNLHLSVLVTPVSYGLSTHTAWELVKFPVELQIKGRLWLERTKPSHPFECCCKKFVAFTRRYTCSRSKSRSAD